MEKQEFLEIYCKNGGIITPLESYLKKDDKTQSILLFGGFIQEFLEKIPHLKNQNNVFLLSPLNFNPAPNIRQFLYEVGCEEVVLVLLAESLLKQDDIQEKQWIKDLDVGYLASEVNFSEEEIMAISQSFVESTKGVLIIGKDIYRHKRASNIAKILGLLTKNPKIEIVFLDEVWVQAVEQIEEIAKLGEIDNFDGLVAYVHFDEGLEYPILQASRQFALVGKIANGDTIEIEFANQKIKANFCEQQEIKGMVGILWLSKQEDIGFCYQKIRVNRIS